MISSLYKLGLGTGQFGLDQPLLTVTVIGDNKQKVGTVLLAPRPTAEAKKEFAGMREGGPTVFLVRDYLMTRLNKQAQDFVQQPTPAAASGATAAAAAPPAAAEPDDQGAQAEMDEAVGDADGDQD